ncbi:MAG: hypothetical protein IT457_02765, partial [Planctomycetes bacterium]|nr:hypothetical protein [Planctomycetota bacterium]
GGFTLWNLTRHLETSGNPIVGQSDYRVGVFADPGHVVVPIASLGRGILEIPGLGVLQIAPASAVSGPALPIGSSRFAELSVPVPADPALAGASIFWQGLDVDLTRGSVHLTNAVRDVVR